MHRYSPADRAIRWIEEHCRARSGNGRLTVLSDADCRAIRLLCDGAAVEVGEPLQTYLTAYRAALARS